MAWIVYGYMDTDAYSRPRGLQGPLPRKRWIPETGKRKKYKRNKSYIAPFAPTSNSAFERKAVQYAEWLAARDNVALPENGRRVVFWSHIINHAGKLEKRIQKVRFGNVEIELPNWDWQPVMTEEHETELALAA